METNSKGQEKLQFNCDLCNVEIIDKLSLELHLKGKKHAKAVERSSRIVETTTQGIFVRGFPPWSKPEELNMFFSQFGEIKDFICGGTRTPFVIVQFVNRFSARNCLSRQLYFYGWPLRISKRRVHEDISPSKKPDSNTDVKDEIDNTHLLNALASCDSFEAQLVTLINELEITDKEKFAVICQNLEATFCNTYPGCKTYLFGSNVTGLALKGSDVDVFMDLNLGPSFDKTDQEMQSTLVNKAKKLFYRCHRNYTGIIAIPKAKTPILKFVHSPTNTRCDLSFKNALGVHNSALIKYYISLDERLRPLLFIIKYWAKKNDQTGPGKLTHYALVMLVLFYIQQLSPPIIPTVYSIRSAAVVVDGWECSFDSKAWNPGHEKNTMTIPELVTGFFKFLSSFEFGLKVVCPLIGQSIPKSLFGVPEQLPEAMNHYKEVVSDGSRSLRVDTDICVQDPYELTHNLTAGLSQKKLELLKNYSAAAAKICCEVLSSPECDTIFLRKVFDVMSIAELISNRKKLIKIPFRKTPACNIVDEDELRQWWFKTVFEFVLKIFDQVLKCSVKLMDETNSDEAGQSVRKVQKLDGQADVSKKCTEESSLQVTEEFSNEKKVYCFGKVRVWEGRKAAMKKVKFDADSNPIVKETLLSDYLMNKKENVDADIRIKFTCVFRPKQNPTLMELELINTECKKGDFVCLSSFLQGHLPHWIGVGLNQPQPENTVEEK